jgi:hypothetical protein
MVILFFLLFDPLRKVVTRIFVDASERNDYSRSLLLWIPLIKSEVVNSAMHCLRIAKPEEM